MTEMKDDLLNWIQTQGLELGFTNVLDIKPLREQASLRSYFRIFTDSGTKIVVVSKPESNENALFSKRSKFLDKNKLRTPKVEYIEPQKGLMIIEDFGDKVLQTEINTENLEGFCKKALSELCLIQAIKPDEDLPILSDLDLENQMRLFEDWFLKGLLNIDHNEDQSILDLAYKEISEQCQVQQKVVCHFDFEFRNLMELSDGRIGILDFQDLCVGPYGTDLVSILKDIESPISKAKMKAYIEFFITKSNELGINLNLSPKEIQKDIDFAGFQRQLRILGTLSRLHLRDAKSFRLPDLKQTLQYLIEDTSKYPALFQFSEYLSKEIEPSLTSALEDIR